jgi:hypothetical protein
MPATGDNSVESSAAGESGNGGSDGAVDVEGRAIQIRQLSPILKDALSPHCFALPFRCVMLLQATGDLA